jgi:hypothetical protein
VLVCDACDRQYDRRRFLRQLVTGSALAAGGVLWASAADAAPPFEALQRGEERLPARVSNAPAVAVAVRRPVAGVAAPRIVSRSEWGADESIRTSGRAFAPIRKIVVHHTASPNNPSNPAGVVRDMYRYHVVDRGYADLGYNFVIDHRGNIYEGRWARNYAAGELHDGEDQDGLGVMGAHAEGVNAGSCGIVLIGNFTSSQPTNAALNALIQLVAWKCGQHHIDPWDSEQYLGLFGQVRTFPNIVPHRGVGQTACPGNGLNTKMDAIRGSVKTLVGSFPPNVTDMAKAIRYRDLAPITLLTPAGNDVRPGHVTTTTSAAAPAAGQTVGASSALVGVRVLSAGGTLTTLGQAQKFGSPAQRGTSATIAIAPGPNQSFWTLEKDGTVLAFGGAAALGSLASTGDATPPVDLTALPSGGGYWILTSSGGVWAFGASRWYGSLARSNPGIGAARIQATPTGRGYWVLGADGGIYPYGDARWYGSAARSGVSGAVDFSPTPTGNGYWVLTAAGQVLAFGDAVQKGGMADLGVRWKAPAVAIVGTPDGRGYHVLTSDGGVYSFGSAPFFGSLAGSGRAAVALAPALR